MDVTAPLPSVLLIEDEINIREGLTRALQRSGFSLTPAANLTAGRRALASAEFDCILLDLKLPDGDGLEFLAELKRGTSADTPVIVLTSFGDGERTIRAMSLGAHEYLTKPFDLARLRELLQQATRSRALARLAPPRLEEPESGHHLLGQSPVMRELWKFIGRAASVDSSVLITGETGVGKELVARAIHRHSSRGQAPFVAVNLAGLPPSLLESELFGHEPGAFTGATQRRIGRVEASAAGTLFLDEIGDLDPALQTKLLRLLQEHTFERLGSNQVFHSRARVIAATLAPVHPGTQDAKLRADLYYRLAILEIHVPPLRARREDIPMLVQRALERSQARGISQEALQLLMTREWPGNVRELFHVVERGAAYAAGEVIDARHLSHGSFEASRVEHELLGAVGSMTLHEAIAALERAMVAEALLRTAGNRAHAARLLGIGRPLLYSKMREHGLTQTQNPQSSSLSQDEEDPEP